MNETTMISAMFEEIKHDIKQIESKFIALENANPSDFSTVESRLDEWTEILQEIENNVKQPAVQRHKHSHTIEVKSWWTVGFICGLCVLVFALIFLVGWQWQIINRFSDNGLKYRYIKTINGIAPDKLLELETIFEYNRNDAIIKELRRQVEEYEWSLKEQARKLEQARLKEAEAESLRKEADKLNMEPVNQPR
jgi:hypothetical protein